MSDPIAHQPPAPVLPGDQAEAKRRTAIRRKIAAKEKAENEAIRRQRERVGIMSGRWPTPDEERAAREKWRRATNAGAWCDIYGSDLPAGTDIKKIERGAGDVVTIIVPGGQRLIDDGDVVRLDHGGQASPEALQALASCAAARGWQSIKLTGSNDFRERAALACLVHQPPTPISWEASQLDEKQRERIERQAAEIIAKRATANPGEQAGIAPAPKPEPEEADEWDEFAAQLKAHERDPDELRREIEEMQAAQEATERRDAALDQVLADGLGEQMPGDGERRARARRGVRI